MELEAEAVARLFHEAYERLAPQFGYKTQEASAVPWEQVPKANRSLMVATAGEVLKVIEDDKRSVSPVQKLHSLDHTRSPRELLAESLGRCEVDKWHAILLAGVDDEGSFFYGASQCSYGTLAFIAMNLQGELLTDEFGSKKNEP